jgi:hypothetical protein
VMVVVVVIVVLAVVVFVAYRTAYKFTSFRSYLYVFTLIFKLPVIPL